MTRNDKQFKVIHGLTIEERFKEVHGMTIVEWQEKLDEQFKAKTARTSEEWYITRVKSSTPIEFLKERNGLISEDDVTLVKYLQVLGLNDGVINVLLDYASIVSRIGFVHPLVREMGESWFKKNILTIEKAIVFVREESKKDYSVNTYFN